MKKCLTVIGLIMLVIVATIIGAVVAVCLSANYTLDPSSFTTDALAMVEKEIQLPLPQGSRGLNMVYKGYQIDPAFVAKIEIPADAEMELKSRIERIANQEWHAIGSLSEKVSWWKPAKHETTIERNYTVNSSLAHVILCHEGSQVVLYVEWAMF